MDNAALSTEQIFEISVELPSLPQIIRIMQALTNRELNVTISLQNTDHAYLDIKLSKIAPTPLNLRN